MSFPARYFVRNFPSRPTRFPFRDNPVAPYVYNFSHILTTVTYPTSPTRVISHLVEATRIARRPPAPRRRGGEVGFRPGRRARVVVVVEASAPALGERSYRLIGAAREQR